MSTTNIDDQNKKHYDLYSSSLSDDSLATVLRFHLLTEYYLEQMICVALARGDKLIESVNYSYAQKLGIVEAIDMLDDNLISSLRNLNKLRNKCSHDLNHEIRDSDLERIGSPFGKDWSETKKEHVETNKRLSMLLGFISAELVGTLEVMEQHFHGIEHA